MQDALIRMAKIKQHYTNSFCHILLEQLALHTLELYSDFVHANIPLSESYTWACHVYDR